MEKTTWIIGMSGTEWDDVEVRRVRGTKDQIKQLLAKIVKEDAKEWGFESGSTKKSDIEEKYNGVLYAHSNFSSSHNDYTATPEMPIMSIENFLDTLTI